MPTSAAWRRSTGREGVAQRPVPTEQRRIFIHKVGPDATAPDQYRVRIMALRVKEMPYDVHKAPLDQSDTAAN